MLNYYELLKISPEASPEEVELVFAEFKKELLKFSPGIHFTEAELRLRNPGAWQAFDVLLDPEKRKEYDALLERDTIHVAYEERNKIAEAKEERAKVNPKYIGVGVIVIAVAVYLLNFILKEQGKYVPPNWRTYFITDEVKIVLPAPIDTNINILPPFMMSYIKNKTCYRSELPGGFSVTIAKFETTDRFKISFKDVSYIVNNDMGSHLAVQYPDSTTFTMSIHDYRAFIRKGNYGYEGSLHAYENYSLVKDNSAIKVIISYIPGNEIHKKYAEIVFNSLLQ